jgi:uroporphyrinogen decarboxylase
MRSLTHRERVLTSLNHEQPDRIPLDFGGLTTTDIVAPAYENLKSHLGLKLTARPDRTLTPEEPVLQKLDIDTRTLRLGRFKGKARKEIDADTYVDEWGTTWKRVPGNFFIAVDGAFKNREPKIEILETFSWPDPDDPGLYEGLKERAEQLHEHTDFAVVQTVLTNGILKLCCSMRGFSEFLVDLSQNTEFACRLLDINTDFCVRIIKNVLRTVGENADVVFFPDDLGHQQSTFVSPKMYRELIKPRHKRLFDAIKAESAAKIVFHSDGAIFAILEDLIELGVDALNPVQVSARHMEPEKLKLTFGDRLTFWGGIDTREILPFGTTEQVRAEVRRMIDVLGKAGGYVLASVQTIQAEVPPENIVAMFDEARSYTASQP